MKVIYVGQTDWDAQMVRDLLVSNCSKDQSGAAMKRPIGLLVAVLSAVSNAGDLAADDWPGPLVRNLFAENGAYFVRIIPGKSMGDVVGFAGSPKGAFARGEFYTRQADRSYKLVADVALQNPISPTDGLVTNNGYLLTFDNWHNFGYGKTVVMYKPDGRLVRALTLDDLYKADRIGKIPTSVSSRWWRCRPHGYGDPDRQTEVYVFEHFGGTFTFKVQTGAFEYRPGTKTCDAPVRPFSASWIGR